MCPKNSQCQHSQNLPSFLSPAAPPAVALRDDFSAVHEPPSAPSALAQTLLAESECILSAHCVSLHCPTPPDDDVLTAAVDLDRLTMSTKSFAAAALLRDGDGCLALGVAVDDAVHGGLDSRPLVTGLVCDERHGDARGRSDFPDDVVDVNDVVHAVVDVILDAVVDLAVAAPVGLSTVVVVTVPGMAAVVHGVAVSVGAVDTQLVDNG